jgi:hypothetical protein
MRLGQFTGQRTDLASALAALSIQPVGCRIAPPAQGGAAVAAAFA